MSAALALDTADLEYVPGRPARHLRVVPAIAPVAEHGVRITRRGRLAVTLTILSALAVAGAGAASGGGANAEFSVVVNAGQTLSEIAAAELPGLPIGDAVARLQVANNLSSPQVEVGQVLIVPSVP